MIAVLAAVAGGALAAFVVYSVMRTKLAAAEAEAARRMVEVESERRAHADEDIIKWSDCKYVQYKKVVDASQICPPVQLAATSGGASNAQPTNVVVTGTVTTQAAA